MDFSFIFERGERDEVTNQLDTITVGRRKSKKLWFLDCRQFSSFRTVVWSSVLNRDGVIFCVGLKIVKKYFPKFYMTRVGEISYFQRSEACQIFFVVLMCPMCIGISLYFTTGKILIHLVLRWNLSQKPNSSKAIELPFS